MQRFVRVAGVALALVLAGTASAAPVTTFGEDLAVGGPAALTNSTAARNAFVASLSGFGTETFEGFMTGANNPALGFGGFGTATLSGGATVRDADLFGAHAFSGRRYVVTTETLVLTFSGPISAFGFFGSDLNEAARVGLRLTDIDGEITELTIPHGFPLVSGANLFFGFSDLTNSYTSIALTTDASGEDSFGFDDIIVGSAGVPEPSSWALMILGFGAVGGMVRRRRGAVADAVRLLFHRIATDQAFPLELKVPNAETRAAMVEGEAITKSGKFHFANAEDMFASREKTSGK